MKHKKITPWAWVPSLYFTEALPYVTVMTISVIMYKRLELSNTQIALYTSWLYLPWLIKPVWSPFVDLLKSKRWWIVAMQLLIGAGMAGIALTIPTSSFFQATLACFWLIAFSSATHDIAADGFYMLGLDTHRQAFFVGIRSTFYRLGMLSGQGVLVMLAGWLEEHPGRVAFLQKSFRALYGGEAVASVPVAWSVTFYLIAGSMIAFGLYHACILPVPASDTPRRKVSFPVLMTEFLATVVSFFDKKQAGTAILFMLFYRFSEAQLVKLVTPFLIDPRNGGGLGLSISQVGWTYGTYGTAGLILGGIIGGIVISRGGLKKWIVPMAWSIALPNLVYVYLSMAQPATIAVIDACIFVEQFGYGFGFTAYMLYLIYYSEGPYKTAHYALCTAFMAAGMMFPGMVAGWLQELLGYKYFFWWIVVCSAVTLWVTAYLEIDPSFGKKEKGNVKVKE